MNRKIGVILSYVLMIFEVISTLLLTPFIIRTLGQAEYGVYKLSAAITAYLLLLDMGVGNAIIRYIAKYRATGEKSQSEKFLGVATIYYTVIALIAIIAGVVLIKIFPEAFAKGLSDDEIKLGQTILNITMINAAVTLGTAAYNNVLIAYEKYTVSKTASIVQIIIRMILTYTVLKMNMGSVGIVSVNLIMTIVCRLYFVLYVVFKIKLIPKFKGIRISFIKEIVIYSTWILLQMVATQLNSTVDQVAIGALVQNSAVILAIYGVGTQVVQYFQSIGTAFTGILMPGVVNMVENNATSEEMTDEMIRIGRIIFMVLIVIFTGFLVCGNNFIMLWAGSENEQAYMVSAILMLAYIFTLTQSIGSQILWAMNEHKEQSILKIAIVILNIFLTIVLIKWQPLLGATIGTFISLVLGDIIVMDIILKKKINLPIIRYYMGVFKGIVPCAIIAYIVGRICRAYIPYGWTGLIINIIAVCVPYAVCMLAFGMNKYEKNLILSLLGKISAKIRK